MQRIRPTIVAAAGSRGFGTTPQRDAKKSFKLVVLGGGAGGCSTAAKFSSRLGAGKVAVVEPSQTHYYQPMWTLVGGGQKSLAQSARPMGSVLPKKAEWIKDSVAEFDPDRNVIVTKGGDEIAYEFLVVAIGMQLNYNAIPGLLDALETPGVGSNYSNQHVDKTWKALQEFKGGNAVFTFPNTPIKCAGAPQKIMYLAEKILRKEGRRDSARIEYHTPLPVLFGVKKYADALWKVVEERDINVSLRSNLVEVKPDKKIAVFQNLDKPEDAPTEVEYSLLHATPPMGPPDVLKNNKKLTDPAGFLDVNKETLRHVSYPNIFGVGDCTNVPCAKTGAAVAGQMGVLRRNLSAALEGKSLEAKYDGYTSCPLVTGPNEVILAEFDFQAPPQPLETFPFNQAKPSALMYFLKAHAMPHIYWQMLNGNWEGPKYVRKALHLGMSK